MSVRVNLLPREAEERERARRARLLLVVAGVVFLALLGGLYFLQLTRVDAANERLAEEEAERDVLRAEVEELGEYAELAERRDEAVEVVTEALAGDVTLAGILQDVAAVMPNDAALTNLLVTILPEADVEGEGTEFDFGPSYGTLSAQGETLRSHAPGVERILLEFEKVAAFFNLFVSSSTIDEQDVTTFSVEADLGPEIFTGRYLDGLPEGLR